jgi:hypothetical protein
LSSPAEPRFSATDIGNGPIGGEHPEGDVTPSRSRTSAPAELPGNYHIGLICEGKSASIGQYLHKGKLAITRVGPVHDQPRGSDSPSACRSHTRRHLPSHPRRPSAKDHDQYPSVPIRERHLPSPALLTCQPAVLSAWRAPTLFSYLSGRDITDHRPRGSTLVIRGLTARGTSVTVTADTSPYRSCVRFMIVTSIVHSSRYIILLISSSPLFLTYPIRCTTLCYKSAILSITTE